MLCVMRRLDIVARATCAVTLALPLGLQGQEPRSVGKPDAELTTPFTRISTLRELKDGRLLMVDERERSLNLVDFKSGTATPIGREGAGPGEYAYPGRLLALPGDSSVLHDPGNGRYLIIKPDGTPGETFRLAEPAFRSLGARGSIPRATDARGSIYFEGPSLTRGRATAPAALDSVPLVRYDRRTANLDTVAWVQLARGNVQVRPGQGGGVSISVGAQAFPARDDWGALPDGSVAIARVRDYHVDWYPSTGQRTPGRPVTINAVAVTEAEKVAWRSARRARAVPRSSGGLSASLPDPEWPAVMPPFVYWQTFSRPNGELWVLRSHKSSENPVYDVFSAPGTLTGRVALPARTRLVGFGSGTVYLVRSDDDDLEYLQRYKLP